jgi:hypothetical protein
MGFEDNFRFRDKFNCNCYTCKYYDYNDLELAEDFDTPDDCERQYTMAVSNYYSKLEDHKFKVTETVNSYSRNPQRLDEFTRYKSIDYELVVLQNDTSSIFKINKITYYTYCYECGCDNIHLSSRYCCYYPIIIKNINHKELTPIIVHNCSDTYYQIIILVLKAYIMRHQRISINIASIINTVKDNIQLLLKLIFMYKHENALVITKYIASYISYYKNSLTINREIMIELRDTILNTILILNHSKTIPSDLILLIGDYLF